MIHESKPKAVLSVTELVTRKIANLSRLELTDQEVATYTQQLQNFLNYVEQLSSVDVSGIEPLNHPLELTLELREDQLEEKFIDEEGHPKVLMSAPEVLFDGYKVPSIL